MTASTFISMEKNDIHLVKAEENTSFILCLF